MVPASSAIACRSSRSTSPIHVGDEALLLARIAPTWIGRDRAAAIREAEPHGSHIILDDGLQNPYVRPDVTFLVIDGETGLGNGQVSWLAGPLGEKLDDALRRVSAVVLIGSTDAQNIAARVSCPVLRATLQPALPDNFSAHGKALCLCRDWASGKILCNLP